MDREQIPNEYADLYRTVLEFMGEAGNDDELDLMEDLMTSMISDARLIIARRNNGMARARKVIEDWEAKHEPNTYKPELKPEEAEVAEEAPDTEEKPMKVVPQDEPPDKELLNPKPYTQKKRRGRPPKHPPMM